MRILIIGSGGREHALAWKLRQNPSVEEIFIAPGNGGTALHGTNIPVTEGDIPGLMRAIKTHSINFVVPGPELPLVLGITDACVKAGVPCFGPSGAAALLEGSKHFAKEVMQEAGIPTAPYAAFTDYEEAAAYVRKRGAPLVIKADGLAAGKGVVVAKTEAEALCALDDMLLKQNFGEAGDTVIVEDLLSGQEVSLLAFCDGATALPMPSAQDHKAVYDGDAGPNTGGMGAYSPAPILPDKDLRRMCALAIEPVLRVMEKRGTPFKGILYAGLMMTDKGPQLLEYNVRFGDPECQPLLMRMESDLLTAMQASVNGTLKDVTLSFSDESALCVVIAAKGYPGSYPKGMPVYGLEDAENLRLRKVKVFQAGTKPGAEEGAPPLSSGGRILGVTALSENLAAAQELAYEAVAKIAMENAHFRRDIGNKGLSSCWACKKQPLA